ncbi:MAG: VIT1/CCC1 transporter family protein [Chloroflexi bacterium]|nr:VIT1/CCC1 transporter family protein [Chloroflexota bacterium]
MNHRRQSKPAVDAHRNHSRLSEVILGGQDGLVNVLGVILGVAAATSDTSIVLVAGLAATFAESVSMGAVAYTSTLADAELYESERQREFRHITAQPDRERDEIRQIYAQKGFSGDLLERIVNTITASPDVWVAVMMAEEMRLMPSDRGHALRSAFVVGFAAIVGSLIPLAPYIWLPVGTSMLLSLIIAALTLFVVGAYKARTTVGHPGRSGLEMALIGTLSALAGYLAGVIFKVPAAP